MSGCTEPIDPEPTTGAGHSIRTVSDETCAEKGRRMSVVVPGWYRKTEPGIGDRVFCISAVDLITGKPRAWTQVLASRATELTFAARPSEPRHADSVAGSEPIDSFSNAFDATDDLVTRNDGNRGFGQFAVDDVEIGPADAARQHSK